MSKKKQVYEPGKPYRIEIEIDSDEKAEALAALINDVEYVDKEAVISSLDKDSDEE